MFFFENPASYKTSFIKAFNTLLKAYFKRNLLLFNKKEKKNLRGRQNNRFYDLAQYSTKIIKTNSIFF